MREIAVRFGIALIGRGLEVARDGCIYVGRDGIIESIERSCPSTATGGSDAIVLPPPALAHVHSADYSFPELSVDKKLSELVAPPRGLKHRLLSRLRREELVSWTIEYYRLARRLGAGFLADFRELGGLGCATAKEAASRVPGLHVITLGRPGPEWPVGCDGVGLSSPLDYDQDALTSMLEGFSIRATHVAEAPATRERGDLEAALDAGFNVLIHGTFLGPDDLELLAERRVGLVLCVRSNMWHGLGVPPVRLAIELGVPLGLGSDNASWMIPDPWREAEAALLVARAQGYRSDEAARRVLEALLVGGYEIYGEKPPLVCEGCDARFLAVRDADSAIARSDAVYSAMVKRAGTGSFFFWDPGVLGLSGP